MSLPETTIPQKPINISLDGYTLVIRVDGDKLSSITESPWGPDDDLEARIANFGLFVVGVIQELEREKEDGTTLVHAMLDGAIRASVENGADWVTSNDNIPM